MDADTAVKRTPDALGADGWEPTAAQRRRWTKEVAKAWRDVSSGVPLAEYKWPT